MKINFTTFKTNLTLLLTIITLILLSIVGYKLYTKRAQNNVVFKNFESTSSFLSINTLTSTLINKEDNLLMRVVAVDGETALREIRHSLVYLGVGPSNTRLNIQAVAINTAAINDFTRTASIINCTLAPGICQGTVTAIRIIYGLNTNSLTLYYKPVKLCRASRSYGQGGEYFGQYKGNEENTIYSYSSGSTTFTPLSGTALSNATAQIAKYQEANNGIQIFRDNTPDDFRSGDDISGDVKSIMFPLQELMAVAKSPGNKGLIYLWNSISEINSPNEKPFIKHTLLLSSDDVTNTGNVVYLPIYGSSFANLSHLCPPSCGTANNDYFTFRLAPF